MQRNKDSKKRKSGFNPNRACYLSSDGKYYCYERWDDDAKCVVTQRLEVGKDLSLELTIMLDESDHDMDLQDRYESELRDPLFDAKVNSYKADPDNEDAVDPWDMIADKGGSPEDAMFAEPEQENPQAVEARRVIDEECTESQQDFFFEHFGKGTPLEEMRQAEAEQTGKLAVLRGDDQPQEQDHRQGGQVFRGRACETPQVPEEGLSRERRRIRRSESSPAAPLRRVEFPGSK